MKKANNEIRNYIADLAIKGAKIKNCGKMCSSCAFKRDSDANMEDINVEAALLSLESGQFNCHIETDVDSGTPCVGFQHALHAIGDGDRKLRTYYVKNVCDCPHCGKKHGDNGTYLKRINANKIGLTKIKCSCGNKFFATYNFMGGMESMKIFKIPRNTGDEFFNNK